MKNIYWIIIIFISILLLGITTVWNFNNLNKSINNFTLPNLDINSLDLSFPSQAGEISEKEFIDDDRKIKLLYPSDWIIVDNLKSTNQELTKENAEILFSIQKIDLNNSFYSFLIIQKIELEEENIEEIISLLIKKSEEKGTKIEIIKKESEETQALLTIKYIQEEKTIFYGKEKIIKDNNNIYLLDIISTEQILDNEIEEINKITSSFQLI